MSSPFRYFRKHTKAFMAVAAVMAIFLFVVGDAVMGRRSGSYGDGRGSGAIVATWNGGSLTEADLASLLQQRRIVDTFLHRLFGQGGGTSYQYDFPQNIPQLFLRGDQELESQVVETEVLSDLADEAGIAVSDQMINRYIEEVGLNKLGGDDIRGILGSLGDPRQTEAIVFANLRKMLAADFYRRMYADAAFVVLPQQKFEDWRKVNDRISLQVATIPAEKFLDKVPEPTDAQLLGLYNDYKERDPGIMENVGGREVPSPQPGFAIPHRVKLQYLLGNPAAKAGELASTVTDEEISKYYEENKSQFLKMDFSSPAPPEGEDADAAPSAEVDAANGENPDTTEAAAESEAASASSAETRSEPAGASETSDDAAAPAGATVPTSEPAAAPTESAAPEAPADSSGEGSSSSNVRQTSPFRLVAYQEAPTAAASEPAPSETTPGVEPSAEDSTATNSNAPGAPPAEPDSPAPTASAATLDTQPPAPAAGVEPAPSTGGAATASESAAQPAAAGDLYQPLEEVRDEIREAIARQKAEEQLGRTMGEAAAALEREYNQYGIRVAEAKEAEKKEPAAPPKLTDVSWLAQQHGLTLETTTDLTARELFDAAVGKAGDAATTRESVTQAAFRTLALYQPYLAKDMDGNYYLVQKIQDTPRRVPEFKEIRDQVAEAWKRLEAAKLAEAEAKKLADEVAKSNTPFDQFFFADRGYPVINQTQFFSWRSYPATGAGMGRPPALSDVPELKNVGPQFMEAAFSLDGNATKAVANYDNTAAYVIRLARRQWSDQELRQLFLEEQAGWPGQLDMMLEHYSQFSSAIEREMLMERADFKWDEEYLKQRQERQAQRGA